MWWRVSSAFLFVSRTKRTFFLQSSRGLDCFWGFWFDTNFSYFNSNPKMLIFGLLWKYEKFVSNQKSQKQSSPRLDWRKKFSLFLKRIKMHLKLSITYQNTGSLQCIGLIAAETHVRIHQQECAQQFEKWLHFATTRYIEFIVYCVNWNQKRLNS